MSPALVDTGASADLFRLPRAIPSARFVDFRVQSLPGGDYTASCGMEENGLGISNPDGIGGAGYTFSAAPPVSRLAGRGRMNKGRKPKSTSVSGIGVDKPFVGVSDGVSTSPIGLGIGNRDWGFASGQRKSGLGLGAHSNFRAAGNVEEKAFDNAGKKETLGVGGSFGVEDPGPTSKTGGGTSLNGDDGVSASNSTLELGTGLRTSDNVGAIKGPQKIADGNTAKESFVFGSGRTGYDSSATRLGDMNIRLDKKTGSSIEPSIATKTDAATLEQKVTHSTGVTSKSVPPSLSSMPATGASGSQLPECEDSHRTKTGAIMETSSVQPTVSCVHGQGHNGFRFSCRTEEVEFKSTSVKPNIFSAVDQKVEFTSKRHVAKSTTSKKKKDKMRPTPVQTHRGHFGKDFLMKEISPSMSSFSPNVSPFPEYFSGNRISRENSLTSHESFDLGTNSEQSDSRLSDSNDALEEDFVALTRQLGLNESGFKAQETASDTLVNRNPDYIGTNVLEMHSTLDSETQAYNAASENLDADCGTSRISGETTATLDTGRLEINGMPQTGFTSTREAIADSITDSKFTFAASSPAHGLAAAHFPKKKNQQDVGADTFTPNLIGQYISSSTQFYPLSVGTSLPSSSQPKKKGEFPYSRHRMLNSLQVTDEALGKNDANSINAVALLAQESCEKWRLRGNQAYASENFSRAEEYYTNGVNSIPEAEKSKACLRVLMLCYSNRAATRMALGKVREALEDCLFASAIDPSFLKVQLRAANCYLALGEIDEASHYFKKLLQTGAGVDQKILAEASEGLRKVQKVSKCINQSAELLLGGSFSDSDTFLQAVDEALLTSPYCEKLLETKAEALLKLRKYEEVIQLSEQSLASAEINCRTLVGGTRLSNQDDPVISEHYYFRLWRYRVIVKSCFQLGKLEQAVELLEKEASRIGNKILESSIPLACTIRELVRLKVAGNDAFQLGKYEEAVEHYSVALAKNPGSCPFAAVCYCNRAAAYKSLNQIADAISDCSLAMALDSNYTKAISRRASLFEVIRDYDQAAKDLRRLVSKLKKKLGEKKNISGISDRSTNLSLANDMREAEVRLSEMEEEARKDVPINFYLILGVEPLATPSEIRKAYRKCALKHHPDKAGQFLGKNDVGDDVLWNKITDEVQRDMDRLFKMIGEAYAVLSDSSKRSRYDLEEEMRSAHRKGKGSSTPRTQTEFQNHPFERSGSGRQGTEVWRSYRQSQSHAQEASRSKWYTG
uniref:J domain-containing protein n=1 Tax=Kalanchoe fedtschenkoi TaxID=63787 RepID=A0A7N1A778_KALFE